jgi:hypothetical protein
MYLGSPTLGLCGSVGCQLPLARRTAQHKIKSVALDCKVSHEFNETFLNNTAASVPAETTVR